MKSLFSRLKRKKEAAPQPQNQVQNAHPTGGNVLQQAAQGNNQSAAGMVRGGQQMFDPTVQNELRDRMQARLPIQQAQPQARTETQAQDSGYAKGEGPYGKMVSLASKLQSSKKGGWGKNSEKFDAVQHAISNVLGMMVLPLTGDDERDRNLFSQLTKAYGSLLVACEAYTSRKTYSSAGEARQGIVEEIKQQAKSDYANIRSFGDRFTTLAPEQRPETLLQAFGEARTRVLTLARGKESDLKHMGGAVSYLGVLDKGSLTDQNASGFFKEDEVYVHGDEVGKVDWEKTVDTLQQRMPLPEDLYQKIRNHPSRNVNALENDPEYLTSRAYHEFADVLKKVHNGQVELSNHIGMDGLLNVNLQKGETFNVSKRNVATSRIARLLGIGDLVAQSETAELVDAEGGGRRTGNMMQKARGTEATSWAVGKIKDEVKAKCGEKDLSAGYVFDEFSGLDDKMSPEFMKSLTSLQVLDNLVGQIDRHAGNFMIDETAEGKAGKVQAIDNDFGFGKTTLMGDDYGRIGNHGRSIMNRQGKLGIAHMDKALADRILQLKKQDVELELVDLLEPWAIEAFWERIEQAQQAIRTDMEENPDSGRFLTEDSQWDENALKDFQSDFLMSENGRKQYETSYVSEFSAAAKNSQKSATSISFGNQAANAIFKEEEQVLGRAAWNRMKGMAPDAIDAMLAEIRVDPKTRQYLKNTGRLTGEDKDYDGPSMESVRMALTKAEKKRRAAQKSK